MTGIVESAIPETADLEQIIHYAKKIGLAVQVVSCDARIVCNVVIGAAMRKRKSVPKFVHERAGLHFQAADLIIAVHLI